MLLCCHLQYEADLLRRAGAVSLIARQNKAARLLAPQRQAASLAAGLLLRHGLLLHGLSDPVLLTDPKGRPYLEGNAVFFSLSHSGDYAACAISAGAVGVDIQKIVPVNERVVRRFCTGEELSLLSHRPDAERAVIELWALKESYLKASGISTEEVFRTGFVVSEGKVVSGPDGWKFSLYDDIAGYCLALCERDVEPPR